MFEREKLLQKKQLLLQQLSLLNFVSDLILPVPGISLTAVTAPC
jgi:hypothetical protein